MWPRTWINAGINPPNLDFYYTILKSSPIKKVQLSGPWPILRKKLRTHHGTSLWINFAWVLYAARSKVIEYINSWWIFRRIFLRNSGWKFRKRSHFVILRAKRATFIYKLTSKRIFPIFFFQLKIMQKRGKSHFLKKIDVRSCKIGNSSINQIRNVIKNYIVAHCDVLTYPL